MYTRSTELFHAGTKGMKWGRRLYQNKDGSLTALGRVRYGKGKGKTKAEVEKEKAKAAKKAAKAEEKAKAKAAAKDKKKGVDEMSDAELAAAIRRKQLEQQYAQLNPKKVSLGKRFMNDSVIPAATEAGRSLLKDTFVKYGRKYLGLDDVDVDPTTALKKSVDKLRLEKDKADLEDYFTDRDANRESARLKREAENAKNKKKIADNGGSDDEDDRKKKRDEEDEDD